MELVASSEYNTPHVQKQEARVNPSAIVTSPLTPLGRSPLNDPNKVLTKNDFKVLFKVSGIEVSGEIVDRQGLAQLIKTLQHIEGILPEKLEIAATEQGRQAETPQSAGDAA